MKKKTRQGLIYLKSIDIILDYEKRNPSQILSRSEDKM